MPVMNGFDATAYIRSNVDNTIPIIALTADVTTIDLEKCNVLGMNDYISKPIDEKLLYNTIIKYVKNPIPRKMNVRRKKTNGSHEKNYINLDNIDSLTNGNLKSKMKLIKMYLDEIPATVDKMKQSLSKMNWEELRMATHKLIPSFSLMGINKEFEEIARKIERYAYERKNLDEIPELIAKIDAVCSGACEELKMIDKKF